MPSDHRTWNFTKSADSSQAVFKLGRLKKVNLEPSDERESVEKGLEVYASHTPELDGVNLR